MLWKLVAPWFEIAELKKLLGSVFGEFCVDAELFEFRTVAQFSWVFCCETR